MIVAIRTEWAYIGTKMTKLLGGAMGLAADVARHVAWYVAHQMNAEPRNRT
jgi:hypothetical protein